MLSVAFAMAGQAAGQGQQSNWLASLLPLLIIFGIFYLLLIRPQQKQQKRHREMLASLKRGDKIITRGGIHGTVEGVSDRILQIQIADNVKIKINKDAVAFVDQQTGGTETK